MEKREHMPTVAQPSFGIDGPLSESAPRISLWGLDHEPASSVGADEAEWFLAFVRREAGPLVGYLDRVMNDQALAEEVAQNVLLRVRRLSKRRLSDGDASVSLYRAATALALRVVHRQRTPQQPCASGHRPLQPRRTTEWASGGQESSRRERHRNMIVSAIAALPERERIALLLHKYQGIPHSQVASILLLSEVTVRSLLFRAYNSLLGSLQLVVADAPRTQDEGATSMDSLAAVGAAPDAARIRDDANEIVKAVQPLEKAVFT